MQCNADCSCRAAPGAAAAGAAMTTSRATTAGVGGVSRRSVGALRRPYILQLRDYGFEPRTHRQQVIRQKYIHRSY